MGVIRYAHGKQKPSLFAEIAINTKLNIRILFHENLYTWLGLFVSFCLISFYKAQKSNVTHIYLIIKIYNFVII